MDNKSKKRGTFLATLFLTKNRRGSHVGMIISFVVFVTFLIFLYTVVRPAIQTGEDKRSILDYMENKIEENTSSEFTETTIIIDDKSNPQRNCIRLEDFFIFANVTNISISKVIVKNERGIRENAHYNPEISLVELRINRIDKKDLFFKVYHYSKFDELNASSGIECELVRYRVAYNITSMNSDDYISSKSLYELIDYYNNHYENLKKEFSFPSGSEFEFSFTQANNTKIGNENFSRQISIFSREVPIQYVDDNANIQSGFINVRVW